MHDSSTERSPVCDNSKMDTPSGALQPRVAVKQAATSASRHTAAEQGRGPRWSRAAGRPQQNLHLQDSVNPSKGHFFSTVLSGISQTRGL